MKRVGQLYREKLVNRIKDGVENNSTVILLSYTQLSAMQVSDLRKSLRAAGARVYISKNSIVQKALKELEHEPLSEKIAGQTALIWGDADSVEISKVLVEFTKDLENVNVQGGLLEGKILAKEDVKRLSDLPSRNVLLAMLLGTIQAPLTRFAGALNAKSRELLSILKQYSERSDAK